MVFTLTGGAIVLVMAVAVWTFIQIWRGKIEVGKDMMNKSLWFLAAVVLVTALMTFNMGVLTGIDPRLGTAPLAAGLTPSTPDMPSTPSGAAVVDPITQTNLLGVTPIQKEITTFNIRATELLSGKNGVVGNGTMGYLEIYEASINPSSSNANPLVRVNITNGQGTFSNPGILTDKNYRVVFNGGDFERSVHAGGWYSVDFGIIQFSFDDFNPSTGSFLLNGINVGRIGSIDDPLPNTAANTTVNDQATGNTGEIIYDLALNNTIVYDESAGDESWFVRATFGVSGGNRLINGLVYCWDNNEDNPMELDEISSIIASRDDGIDFGIDAQQVDEWVNEACVDLTGGLGVLNGGVNGVVKFQFTYDEAALNPGTDVFNLRIDDLLAFQGKDIVLNKGADSQSITFKAQA